MTKIGHSISSPKNINISVPQGSHLGPLLFLLYINDLPNISNVFSPILFADDLTINFSGKDEASLIQSCNLEIEKLVNWTLSN